MKTINQFKKKGIFLLVFLSMFVTTQFGCKKDYETTMHDTGLNQGTREVSMQNNLFTPTAITIGINTQVIWANNDAVLHTVTSDDGLFSSGEIPAGGTFTYSFISLGIYDYHCSLHQGMTGKIIVK